MGGSERKVPPIVGVDIPNRPRQVGNKLLPTKESSNSGRGPGPQ